MGMGCGLKVLSPNGVGSNVGNGPQATEEESDETFSTTWRPVSETSKTTLLPYRTHHRSSLDATPA